MYLRVLFDVFSFVFANALMRIKELAIIVMSSFKGMTGTSDAPLPSLLIFSFH